MSDVATQSESVIADEGITPLKPTAPDAVFIVEKRADGHVGLFVDPTRPGGKIRFHNKCDVDLFLDFEPGHSPFERDSVSVPAGECKTPRIDLPEPIVTSATFPFQINTSLGEVFDKDLNTGLRLALDLDGAEVTRFLLAPACLRDPICMAQQVIESKGKPASVEFSTRPTGLPVKVSVTSSGGWKRCLLLDAKSPSRRVWLEPGQRRYRVSVERVSSLANALIHPLGQSGGNKQAEIIVDP